MMHGQRSINAPMLKSHFVHTTCHKCDTFRSILIILRELLNTIKTYTKMQIANTEIFVFNMFRWISVTPWGWSIYIETCRS